MQEQNNALELDVPDDSSSFHSESSPDLEIETEDEVPFYIPRD